MPKPSNGGKSPYQLHVDKWSGGCGAGICSSARRVCHARGDLPCDVLFIGEAPGDSEDVIGRPFCGPAGHLLDYIIAKAFNGVMLGAGAITDEDVSDGEPVRWAITNLVGCVPRDPEKGGKAGEPSVEDIITCAPRLQELIDLARPRMVVAVGTLAKDWLKPGYKNPAKIPDGCMFVEIYHPAYILRQNVANQGFIRQQQWVKIRTAVMGLDEYQPPPPVREEDIPF